MRAKAGGRAGATARARAGAGARARDAAATGAKAEIKMPPTVKTLSEFLLRGGGPPRSILGEGIIRALKRS